MPVFLMPWYAVAGLVAAAAMIALHMIRRRRRAPRPLPTARFVPRAQQRSTTLERRPRDLLSLLLRAGALAAAGFALARPVVPVGESGIVHVVIADVSGRAEPESVLDSARSVAGETGIVIISTDSALVAASGDDPPPQASAQRQPLTAALIAALRQAAREGSNGRRARMTIVSSLSTASVDSATLAVRRMWPGSIALLPVADEITDRARGIVQVRGSADDPLQVSVALVPRASGSGVLLVRDRLTSQDSAAVRAGAAIVYWPADAVPPPFSAAPAESVQGVTTGDYTFVANLVRAAAFPTTPDAPAGRIPLRWIDGVPAAIEQRLGAGCVRAVALRVPSAGDLPISRGFLRVVSTLTEPCGGLERNEPLPPAVKAQLEGDGVGEVMLRADGTYTANVLPVRALLVLAIVALLLDLVVRRRRA